MWLNKGRRGFAVLFAVLLAVGLSGCGQADGRYPVVGQVFLHGRDQTRLAGHAVEAALRSDPAVRASGVIGPDGRFSLTTFDAGVTHPGTTAGAYDVRVMLVREGDGTDEPSPVANRYLEFATSGLSLEVPSAGAVRFDVSAE